MSNQTKQSTIGPKFLKSGRGIALSIAVVIVAMIAIGFNWSWVAAVAIAPLAFIILSCGAMIGMILYMFMKPSPDNQTNAN